MYEAETDVPSVTETFHVCVSSAELFNAGCCVRSTDVLCGCESSDDVTAVSMVLKTGSPCHVRRDRLLYR